MTLHRPSNVDDNSQLDRVMTTVAELSHRLPVLFPIHPRTAARIGQIPGLSAWLAKRSNLICSSPLGYLDCVAASVQARLILTDSGGLQEESTALGVPCLTLRKNTERPITVEQGTSTLVGHNCARLRELFLSVLDGSYKRGACPELWDGRAAERIARHIDYAIGGEAPSAPSFARAA